MNGTTAFGEFFREARRKTGLSLREFCRKNGFDWGNTSKLERGKLPPPQRREKLEQYCRALGMEEGSDDWYEFFDLAATCGGRIPEGIMRDEQLVAELPALFRTLEKTAPSAEKLRQLIEDLREV